MNRSIFTLLILTLMFAASLMAQTGNTNRPVTTAFAVLTKSVESKSASVGQELILQTIKDVIVDGQMVIPRGSKFVGHITEVETKGKDMPQSELYIVIDKAVRKDGVEIPLQAIIAAVGAPQSNSLSSDPTYGMMHSNEPKMIGSSPGSAVSIGALPPGSKASSTAAVATANIKGQPDEPLLLNDDSRGAVGYEGLSLSWHLLVPPPVTVIASKGKNVKLESGTQVLLRMAPPRLPN